MKKMLSLLSVLVLSIMLCNSAFAQGETAVTETGTITGQIAVKGKGSMSGGTVFFFSEVSGPPPSSTKYWRVPSDAFSLDENGRFTAMLPAGKYYIGAIKRLSGGSFGPPRDGDFFFLSNDEKGNPKQHTVMQFKPLDLGVIEEAVPFSSSSLITEEITSIQGTISDANGNAAEGMLVFAYPTPIMFGRPLFVSEMSDKNGKYLLRLYGGGTYYLGSRANYGGGPPTPVETLGSYAKGQPLVLKTGETKKGIDITVTRVGVPE